MVLNVLDAGVLIGFLDGGDACHLAARSALAGAVDADGRLAMPDVAYRQVLEGPGPSGGVDVQLVDQVIDSLPIEVVPIDDETEERAAALCSGHDVLEAADAVVIATAEVIGATVLFTTRRDWPTAEVLDVGAEIRVL